MQLGSFLAVMLRPSFVPTRLLQSLQQGFIVDQAPGWFVGPMVLMLLVGFINQTGPGHSLFEAGFAAGFWFFLAFSTLSVLIAWTFEAFPHAERTGTQQNTQEHCRRFSEDVCSESAIFSMRGNTSAFPSYHFGEDVSGETPIFENMSNSRLPILGGCLRRNAYF